MEWREITQNNCDEVYEFYYNGYPIMIANKMETYNDKLNKYEYHVVYYSSPSLSFNTMAKFGGYYYIVLPKLK